LLRIAIPNKGSLARPATDMLREAGYRQRASDRDLTCVDPENAVTFFYLRPRDIATYVGSGELDLGITGRDLMIDSGADATEVLGLGFAGSTFRFAAPAGTITELAKLADARVATSFPGLVRRHLAEHQVSAQVIRLDGAVENAVALGVADAIADVVETGATLRQAGLEVFGEPILTSEAVLIQPSGGPGNGPITQLVRRLQGVLVARRYVMLAYDVRADQVDAACAITPGIEAPTISPLHREGWVAVQAMISRTELHRIMDELYELGARAILATELAACRL
jgi:ATP phosphoribosyltransferase